MRYEKGRKDASKRRILEVAAQRFCTDGIAATGLAGIMSDAGLTNGAFYPHFKSKAALVGESIASGMEGQSAWLSDHLAAGGIEAVIAAYLSPEHRDHPGLGCPSSALLPELGREPPVTRALYTDHFLALARQIAGKLDPDLANRDGTAIALFATLIGTMQLARAIDRPDVSDRILAHGADAARALARQGIFA
ncbi:TetR family transcriptional regulator [Aureimonas sp. Leaf460]|nr:TetR/AcrR family transcriptional regulator [Aureimonas sp. Leaf460]KQT62240.1 TetR family transcriptional regulator [Aureimonas sp. Leaf427]KQT72524.1 TetR family transcriptional regulator [Aureimonas sp. Leaf460]